ncbi:MAG: ATP-binding protein [Bacteroidota bacterium]|nr:ATP-binding protein [Bacteroidota bacterium]
MTPSEKNALAVNQYLNFLAEIFRQRLKNHFAQDKKLPKLSDVMKIVSARDDSELSTFIRNQKMSPEEITVLILALAPHVRPAFFDSLIEQNLTQSGDFPQLGGIRGKQFRGFLASGETALFLLAGDELHKRFEFSRLFSSEHFFSQKNLIWLDDAEPGEPPLSGKLEIGRDYLELFIQGKISRPKMSMDFPAEYITTELTDDDLVLASSTNRQIAELENWIKYQDTLMNDWNMKRRLKPGYRSLFHGPPGTGKTLTALIIGKNTNRDVFRIDLSMVVSKFIGETEKNLSQLFERAKNKDWILFFDEADALFGKRTNVRDAHDKYANQEVAYLLQRIENHDGLVILASNFKSNIDDAFIRRFQSVVYFPPPTAGERLQLWKKTLPSNAGLQLPSEADLSSIARKYEITGAGIVNVVQYCCLESLANNSSEITVEQIKTGIEREYQKEGKVF